MQVDVEDYPDNNLLPAASYAMARPTRCFVLQMGPQ